MRYLLRRFVQGIFILLGVSMITFFLPTLYFSPLALAIQVLGHNRTGSTAYHIWATQHGLYRPIYERYWSWLDGVLHGNFGISYTNSNRYHTVTVNEVLGGNIWRSVWLVTIPTIASILLAIPIGLTQALRRNKPYDHIMTTGVYVLYSTPAVLVCILLGYYIAIKLHIGTVSVGTLAQQESPTQFPGFMLRNWTQFLLPFAAILFLSIGGLSRYMRGSALDTLVQDYVRTARAKGANPARVLFRHVLRPSVIPLLQIVGLTLPAIIGGALIVEDIFNFPGMGLLTVSSVTQGDFNTVLAITLFTAVLTVAGNLVADVLTAAADPRIRLGAKI